MRSRPAWIANPRRRAAVVLAAAAILLASASSLLEPLSPGGPTPRTLDRLRRTAVQIKAEFASLLEAQQARLTGLAEKSWPEEPAARFDLLRQIELDPQVEGAALAGPDGELDLWRGQVLDFRAILSETAAVKPGGPFIRLVRSKSSSFLVLARRAERGYAVLFRLLAFTPQFKSRYLAEYQFLPARLRSNGRLEYIDFREDVTRYDDLFRRGSDEFIGRPGLEGRIQSLFFPLRDPVGRIVATVNIRSQALSAVVAGRVEALRLAAILAAFLALLLILLEAIGRDIFRSRIGWRRALAAAFALTAMRGVLLPLGRMSLLQEAFVFSPAGAGFRSALGLTRSPADLFATSLWLASILLLAAWALVQPESPKPSTMAGASPPWLAWSTVIAAGSAAFAAFDAATGHVLRNASFNPLEFPLQPDFLLLFNGLILVWAAVIAVQAAGLAPLARRLPRAAAIPAAFLPPLLMIAAGARPWPRTLVAGLALAALAAAVGGRRRPRPKALWALAILLQVVFFYGCLADGAAEKSRILAGRFVKDSVQSLEPWARFLLNESIPELDRNDKAIRSFLRSSPASSTLARDIWARTLPARFNWYSSLEILGPEGILLNRFSLNVPKIFRPAADQVSGPDWTIAPVAVPFMGRERRFLTASKEWTENGAVLGRVLLSLSLDPDMLPFLYSANPYFELLRVNTIPSLSGFDIRFAVFDKDGRILFNPFKLASGIPAAAFDGPGRWSRLDDKGRSFDLFAFRSDERSYAVYLPRRTWRSHVVNLARTVALSLLGLGLPLLAAAWISARRRGRRFFWSFSDRVFLSFLIVALVPILVFAAFSRSFFNRLFTQQFVEKAEIHADMARGVMDDFLFLDPAEGINPDLPPEDLVLWISNTIGNDVNLYRDGRLIASSRREFFDAGLLPEILDGEVYFRLRYENNPTIANETRIGAFSLRTLTVPYEAAGRRLTIALPFPFERRDIASASQELIEFLVFMAVFLLGLVPLIARGVGTRIVEPVRRLLAGTREASLGNLEIAIDYEGRDEMKTLVDGFNAMIRSLKQHQQELADLGKKAAWAEMARKVAHEIKNPLTPIQLSAEHILRVFEDHREDIGPALKESISYIVGEVENLRRIAQEFLEVSREPVTRKDRVRVDDLVRETVEPYRRLLAERIVISEAYAGGEAMIRGDRDKLKIALRNLLTNAIESIRGRGEIRVRVETSGQTVRVELEDTGAGMEAEVLERIFEPYFSTKDVGTGLGLPITKKIVEDHGGTIHLESLPGRGTKVRLGLPEAGN
ncbi:MAG: HAMP domain-containing sensor histidine kinase [Candidatus Aminicenantes bacterium]|nr:HAMP domain-containing sensor histidine kinase [Candidatus Aminicenantes bacterium]